MVLTKRKRLDTDGGGKGRRRYLGHLPRPCATHVFFDLHRAAITSRSVALMKSSFGDQMPAASSSRADAGGNIPLAGDDWPTDSRTGREALGYALRSRVNLGCERQQPPGRGQSLSGPDVRSALFAFFGQSKG